MDTMKYPNYLDCFDARILPRAYDYFVRELVIDLEQTDSNEYSGRVAGSLSEPYKVKINLENPTESSCDCPYAKGGCMCKHMAALWMALFPDRADEYRYYDYYRDDEDDWDDEYYYRGEREAYSLSTFKQLLEEGLGSLHYDELLQDFIDSLPPDELRNTLRAELYRDRERTFNRYLKERYKEFISKKGDAAALLDTLNARMIRLEQRDDYDCKDYSLSLLDKNEKNALEPIWLNDDYRKDLKKLFAKPGLAVYDGYKWVAERLAGHMSEYERGNFTEELYDHLVYLKSAGLRPSKPKANVLIAMCIICRPGIEELAVLIAQNAKYKDFVSYCIESVRDKKALYAAYAETLREKPLYNRPYVAGVLRAFYEATGDEEILKEYHLYDYLDRADESALTFFREKACLPEYEARIERSTKSLKQLVTLYRFTGEADKLFDLLTSKGSLNELIRNTDFLRDTHEESLREYFESGFYAGLTGEKNRKVYHAAARYVEGLAALKHGNEYVDSLIEGLRGSTYEKCHALFEEIDFAAGRRKPRSASWRRYR